MNNTLRNTLVGVLMMMDGLALTLSLGKWNSGIQTKFFYWELDHYPSDPDPSYDIQHDVGPEPDEDWFPGQHDDQFIDDEGDEPESAP